MDRPIKLNPKGKYNLDFIDWTNEWQQIAANYDPSGRQTKKSPIYGMPTETFLRLMEQQLQSLNYSEEAVQEKVYGSIEGKLPRMQIGKSEKECTICLKHFSKGEVIRLLPCKHIFHEQCVLPWLKTNSHCPNCRLDLNKHFTQLNCK